MIVRAPVSPPGNGFGLLTRQRQEGRSVHHHQEFHFDALAETDALHRGGGVQLELPDSNAAQCRT